MQTLNETATASEASSEYFAPLEHWAYQVDSPLRPVHEILEAAEVGSSEAPPPWDRSEALAEHEEEAMYGDRYAGHAASLARLAQSEDEEEDLEFAQVEREDLALEELELEEEDLDEEDEDFEAQFEDEDLDEDELEEEDEEGESAPTADSGHARHLGEVSAAEREEELELEEEFESEDLDEEELVQARRPVRGLASVGTGPPRRRRIFLRRGDTLVVKWR